jgi:hypothetical protein
VHEAAIVVGGGTEWRGFAAVLNEAGAGRNRRIAGRICASFTVVLAGGERCAGDDQEYKKQNSPAEDAHGHP